jgi:hypothetical protein
MSLLEPCEKCKEDKCCSCPDEYVISKKAEQDD